MDRKLQLVLDYWTKDVRADLVLRAVLLLVFVVTLPLKVPASEPSLLKDAVQLIDDACRDESLGAFSVAVQTRLNADRIFARLHANKGVYFFQETDNDIALGVDYFRLGQQKSAYSSWDRALATVGRRVIFWPDQDAIAYRIRDSFPKYISLLSGGSVVRGDDLANGFVSIITKGLRAAAQSKDDVAFLRFQEAANLDPFSSWPELFIGDLQLARSDKEAGRRTLVRLLEHRPCHYSGPTRVAVEMLVAYAPESPILKPTP